MTLRQTTRTRLLGSAATTAALLFAAPGFAATGIIDIAALSAVSDATLAITSPQNNTAAVSATTSIAGTPVVIELEAYTTVANAATGTFGVSDNSVTATATGNTTATPNGNLLEITVLPTFNDSAAVTSLQTNVGNVSALSTDVRINATIEDAGATVHELQGTLTVDGNTVSTAGTANTAVNTLRVADAVSVTDDGAAGSIVTGTTADLSTVGADLLVTSVQNSATGNTVATTTGTVIDISVESVDVSTVLLEDNRIAATARGNQSTNTIDTGVNSAALDASVAVSNYQRLNDSDATATVTGTQLLLQVPESVDTFGVDNSTLAIDANTTSAAATGNSTTQTLNLSANDVLGGALLADLGADVGAGSATSATGEALISNVQDRTTSDVSAQNVNGMIELKAWSDIVGGVADVLLDSSLSVSANMAEAVAVGNNASGSMLLDGNTVGGGAGIVSSQAGDTSTTTANLQSNTMELVSVDTMETSTADLTGNTQRAIAAGNIVSSSLTVDTNEAVLTATDGAASARTTGAAIDSNAAYAVGTLQSQLGAVTSSADNGGFALLAETNVTAASTLTNESNTRVAAAYGNDASSRIAIDATVIDTTAFSSVAASVSQQELNAAITARAGGLAAQDSVVTTYVNGFVSDSSVSTSANTVEALAMGNRTTTTSVMVDATTIDTTSAAAATAATTTAGVSSADASFAAVSAQDASGSVTATLQDSTGVDSSWIETTVDGAVTNSSIASDSNTLRAGATANSGLTAVALDATNVNTTASVVNGQETDAAVSALIGVSGALNEGGVTLKADGTILDSTLSVASNLTTGSVTGNAGTNSLSVTGTNVGAGSISTIGAVAATNTSATADASLSSTQNATTSVLTSLVFGTFGIDTDEAGVTTTDSTVAVDRNTQAASATGNTVTNTTLLDGSNVNTTSATTSVQTVGVANIDALSDVDMFVEAGSSGSDISISANRNQSVAVANDATSTVTATGSNVTTRDATADATATTIGVTASADQALLSSQTAAGTVDSSAITDIFNQDTGVASTDIANSTIAFDSNVSIAESTANRGTNRLVLGGDGASLTASGAAVNDQTSTAAVTASVDADVNVSMLSSGAAVVAATGSTLSVDDNSSSSMARGNVVTNALTASGTLISDPTDVAADADFLATTAVANGAYLLLSDQNSTTGAIDSNAVGTFGIALNNDAASALATTGSSISVSGNLLSSMGVANVATNSASLSGTTVDTSVAVLNGQTRSGAETADTTMGLTAVTASSGSTVDMSSNTARAISVANDATNSASVTGTNVLADSGAGNASIDTLDDVLAASNIVGNRQSAAGTTAATVTLNGANQEAAFTDTLGVATGTVSFNANTAMAEASSNRATNTLTLGDGALLDASGAVFNDQENASAATANATSVLGLTLDSAALATAVLANSTASIDGNSTTALARGNTATNVLNASAANVTSGAGTSVSTFDNTPTQTVSAGFGILNAQSNVAIVTAQVDNSFYGMALNDTGEADDGVTNSTLSVAGNMVSAQAMGNTGGSSLTLTGLNSSTANAAVGNTQSNVGDVIASIASTTIGSTSYGTLGASAVSIADNVLASAASGNSTTNLLIRN